MAMISRSRKFILLSIIGLVGIFGIYFVNTFNLTNRLPWVLGLITFFKVHNDIYFNDLLRWPVGIVAGSALMLFLLSNVLLSKKKSADCFKYMYLYVIVITAAIFFIYVADRYPSIYYISHILPIAIILIIAGFWHLIINFPNLKKQLLAFFILVLLFNFGLNAQNFYAWERNYGDFSTAYQVIIDRYNFEEEVIFGQYLRTYYLRPLNKINKISMLNYKKYTFDQFLDDLDKYDAGWITWETRKSYHIDDEIIDYVSNNFQKQHGIGVDDTKVEVYYFSIDKLQDDTSLE